MLRISEKAYLSEIYTFHLVTCLFFPSFHTESKHYTGQHFYNYESVSQRKEDKKNGNEILEEFEFLEIIRRLS